MLKKTLAKVAVCACAVALAAGCLVLSACGGSGDGQQASGDYTLVESGKLTIGSDLDYPPMEYLEDGKPAGFGVDMMEEVCKRLGLEMNFLSPQNFDSLITQVSGGASMDVAVSSITINDERAEQVDFSTPYYDSNLAIVVTGDSSYADKDALAGKAVGVQSGSTGEEWAKENLADSTITPFTGPTDAFAALSAGKVEAVVLDAPVAANYAKNDADAYKVMEEIATGEQYGIAVNKDNAALTEAINQVLAEMEEDSTMDELNEKWFG